MGRRDPCLYVHALAHARRVTRGWWAKEEGGPAGGSSGPKGRSGVGARGRPDANCGRTTCSLRFSKKKRVDSQHSRETGSALQLPLSLLPSTSLGSTPPGSASPGREPLRAEASCAGTLLAGAGVCGPGPCPARGAPGLWVGVAAPSSLAPAPASGTPPPR